MLNGGLTYISLFFSLEFACVDGRHRDGRSIGSSRHAYPNHRIETLAQQFIGMGFNFDLFGRFECWRVFFPMDSFDPISLVVCLQKHKKEKERRGNA